jgi:DNA/RNA-binding domain of Phe-tRNA-synthetase-like protein
LAVLEEDMSFDPIGGKGEGLAKRGEYAYVDEKGVLCRMDIKQCDRTKITEETTDALVIFQGHEGIGEDVLRESIRFLDESLQVFEVCRPAGL